MVRASLEVGEAPFWESQTAGGSNSRQTGSGPEVQPFVIVDQPRHNSVPPTRIPPARRPRSLEQRTPSCNCKKPLTYLGLGLLTSGLAAGSIYLCTKLLQYANDDRNNEDQKEYLQCLGVGFGVLGALYSVTTIMEWWRCSQPKEPGTFLEETAVAACGPFGLCAYCCAGILGD